MEIEHQKKARYQCMRCGGETENPGHAQARFCVLCGVSGFELDRVLQPASPDQSVMRPDRSRVRVLPAAV